eukprot:8560518-Karenia_brevis.AAC.1
MHQKRILQGCVHYRQRSGKGVAAGSLVKLRREAYWNCTKVPFACHSPWQVSVEGLCERCSACARNAFSRSS